MTSHGLGSASALLLMVAAGVLAQSDGKTDREIAGRPYRPVAEVTGDVRVVGSGLLGHLVTIWSEDFRRFQPKVKIEVACEGSETALPELASEGAVLGAMSRPLTKEEVAAFEAKTGRKLYPVAVCEDQIAAIVHKDNPIEKLTAAQIRQVFAYKDDADKQGLTWGHLGLTGDWAGVGVNGHGRDATSGTRTFLRTLLSTPGFKERAQKEHGSSPELVAAVAADKGGIGYCRPSMAGKDVKIVPIISGGSEMKAIKRHMYLVASSAKDKPIPAAALEFLLFGLSQTGQSGAIKDGFVPLERAAVLQQLDRLGVSSIK